MKKKIEKLQNDNSRLENMNTNLNRQLGSTINELEHVKSKLQSTEKELSKWDGYDQVIKDAIEYQNIAVRFTFE